MPTIRYTLDADTKVTVAELAMWVRSHTRDEYSSRDCIAIARTLLAGQAWEPPYYTIKHEDDAGPCSYVVIPDPDPYEEMKLKWTEIHLLLQAGAAGDAESAIEYCRRVASGEIQNGPYAGSAA